jgi:hypothetical protein
VQRAALPMRRTANKIALNAQTAKMSDDGAEHQPQLDVEQPIEGSDEVEEEHQLNVARDASKCSRKRKRNESGWARNGDG